jgi:hypothetical protein
MTVNLRPDLAGPPSEIASLSGGYQRQARSSTRSQGVKDWLLALRPVAYGLAAFLLLCASAGRTIARHEHFSHFDHFITLIQPQTQYYPNISEIMRTAFKLAPKDKILVVIGGNSVFRGTGQSIEDLWSKRLQDELGDKYAVVNLAIDQAGMESFTGVAFRALEAYYPRSVYVGTLDVRGFDALDGLETYKYLYWDAYYKGILPVDQDERVKASRLRWQEMQTLSGLEMHAYAILDGIFYFSSVKNYLSYHVISPDWTAVIGWPFMRREWYREGHDPNIALIQQQVAADKEREALMTTRFTSFGSSLVEMSTGHPELRPEFAKTVAASFDSFFPRAERDRVIGVITAPNPHNLALVSPVTRQSLSTINERVLGIFQSLGYQGMIAGVDYLPEDFVDQGHLMASGGRKLADHVAAAVRQVAGQKGYE